MELKSRCRFFFCRNHDEADQLVRVAGMAVNSVTGDYTETVFQTARRYLAESGLELKRLREFDSKIAQRRVRLASLGAAKKAEQEDGADHMPSRQVLASLNPPEPLPHAWL